MIPAETLSREPASEFRFAMFETVEDFWDLDDLSEATEAALSSLSGGDLIEELEASFLRYIGSPSAARFVSSGRAAITLALRDMGTQSARKYVLVPAFCCKAVGESILEAGKLPLLLDSGDELGSIDWDAYYKAIGRPDVGAVVFPHLFGSPLDLDRAIDSAWEHGVGVIEDCAHCLGGITNSKMAGTSGDYAIFSFGYDKPLSLSGGGMLVKNGRPGLRLKELVVPGQNPRGNAALCEAERRELEIVRGVASQVRAQQGLAHPRGAVSRIRGVLGRSRSLRWLEDKLMNAVNLESPAAAAGPVRAALGLRLLQRYPSIVRKRNDNHALLAAEIRRRGLGEIMSTRDNAAPAWLRAKFTPRCPRKIDDLAGFLTARGFRAGRLNWARTLDEEVGLGWKIPRIGSLAKARRFARTTLDLPIHQRLDAEDIARLAAHIAAWAEQAARDSLRPYGKTR